MRQIGLVLSGLVALFTVPATSGDYPESFQWWQGKLGGIDGDDFKNAIFFVSIAVLLALIVGPLLLRRFRPAPFSTGYSGAHGQLLEEHSRDDPPIVRSTPDAWLIVFDRLRITNQSNRPTSIEIELVADFEPALLGLPRLPITNDHLSNSMYSQASSWDFLESPLAIPPGETVVGNVAFLCHLSQQDIDRLRLSTWKLRLVDLVSGQAQEID